MSSLIATTLATISAIMFGTYSVIQAAIIKELLRTQGRNDKLSQEFTAGWLQAIVFVGASLLTFIFLLVSIFIMGIEEFLHIFGSLYIDIVIIIVLILIHFGVNYIVILAIFRESISRIFALVTYSPVFATIIAFALLGESVTMFQAITIIICLAGLSLVMDPRYYIRESNILNLLMMLAIPIIFGLQNTLFKSILIHAMQEINTSKIDVARLMSVVSIINIMIFTATFALAFILTLIIKLEQPRKKKYDVDNITIIKVFLSGLIFAIGSITSFLALNIQKVALVVTIITMQSIIPILYGALRLGEKISLNMMIGIIIALAGVIALTCIA